jgi:probable poly-beta-1,6-N-acetyl-D-glucosamine export protein
MDRRLFYLNGLAIFSVICNHAAGWGYTAMYWWTFRYISNAPTPDYSQIGSISYYVLLLIKQWTTFAVPVFLFVSGIFVVYSMSGKLDQRFKASRLRIVGLIIPYLVWSAITFISDGLFGDVYQPLDYLRMVVLGQATAAFFYVPVIIQCYLLAIVLVPLIRKYPRVVFISAIVFHFGFIILTYIGKLTPWHFDFNNELPVWLFPRWAFYFVWGLTAGMYPKAWRNVTTLWKKWTIIGLLFFSALAVWGPENLVRLTHDDSWYSTSLMFSTCLYSIFIILVFAGWAPSSFPLSKTLQQLGSRSYGIYLIHPLVQIYVAKLLYHYLPWFLGQQWLFMPIMISFGLGIPIIAMELICHSPVRNIYKFVFG